MGYIRVGHSILTVSTYPLSLDPLRPQVSLCKVFIMRFCNRLIVSLVVVLVGSLVAMPHFQRVLRAEESELVLKTAGDETKPETKESKGKAKDDSNGAKKDEDTAAKSQAKPASEAQAEKPKPKYPPFAELLKGAKPKE